MGCQQEAALENVPSVAEHSTEFLRGGGEMGRRIRTYDWANTSLGAPEAWPERLKTVVSLILSANQPMFIAWGAEHIWLYNDAFIPILGKKHPGALGRGAIADVWAEASGTLGPLFERVFAGEAIHIEDFEIGLDRQEQVEQAHFAFSYTPIREVSGAVAGLFGVCSETTEQIRSQHRIAEAQDRQRNLFQKAPGFIAVLRGPSHVFEFVNDAYVRLTGFREFIGRPVRDVFPEIAGQGFFEILDQVYRTGERFVAAQLPIHFRRNGTGPAEERYLDFVYERIPDERDRPGGIFVEGYDVTERWRAEQALRDLNATLERKVIERTRELDRVWRHSRDLLVVIGRDGLLRSASPAWTRILGHDVADIVARRFLDFVHADDVAVAGRKLDAAADKVDPDKYEVRHPHIDGDVRWISWITSAEGEWIYGYGRDCTAEKLAEAELTIAQKALRESQKLEAMGQLTGGVAHDFNNLLTPIIGGLDTLLRRRVGTDRDQRLIAGAIESAERARTLVQRLLAFARRQPLQPVAIDMAALVHGMTGLLSGASGSQIDLTVDVPSELPPASGDPSQIEMALLNLCVNARDAMPNGGALHIAACEQNVARENRMKLAPGPFICVSVSDTGIGMDEGTRSRAIEPFFSTKGIGRGTGLGLSMVHGVATQLGGALQIASAPGAGTRVELWLPVSRQPLAPTQPELRPDANKRAFGAVLLVDDEVLIRAITADMLTELGFRVLEASSGEAALEMLKGESGVELLVTDHLMPGMSGVELARSARKRHPELPVIVISGYAEVEGIAPDLPRLAKPFKQVDLADSIRRSTHLFEGKRAAPYS